MALRLITAPTVQPISLAQAKWHLRVEHDVDDDLISIYINAARSFVDGENGFLGRALVAQTWELVLDAFPTSEIKIPLPPLQEVVSVAYSDTAGAGQTLPADQYYVDAVSEPGWIVPITSGWPSTLDAINAVTIRFIAGYPASTDSPPDLTANIPGSIISAMLLHIGHMYANREDTAAMPRASEMLLRPFRVQLGMA